MRPTGLIVIGGALAALLATAGCSHPLSSLPAPQLVTAGAAALGPDARIYVIGSNTKGALAMASYDPSSDSWRQEPAPPAGGSAMASGPDGRIYLVGGGASGTERYDVTSRSWSAVAPFPIPATALGAASANGRLYAFGGCTGVDGGTCDETASALAASYDVTSDSWSVVASMPAPNYGMASSVGSDGRIYSIGSGMGSLGGPAGGMVIAYDPKVNAWSSESSLNQPRAGLGAAMGSDGRIYAVGGLAELCNANAGYASDGGFLDPETCNDQLSKSVEAYDVHANRWSFVAPLPTDRFNLAVAAGADGRIYAFGGSMLATSATQFNSVPVLIVNAYTPFSNSWTPSGPVPPPE